MSKRDEIQALSLIDATRRSQGSDERCCDVKWSPEALDGWQSPRRLEVQ